MTERPKSSATCSTDRASLTDARGTPAARARNRTSSSLAVPRMLGGDDGRTLFVVANRYGAEGASDGVVLTHRVEVPHAHRP